jgi:RNA polymerase sigma factor (TIGR02999 family)
VAGEGGAEVTQLLRGWRDGDGEALARLTAIVYDELHRRAHRYVKREPAAQLIQTTDLVHDAFLRLAGSQVDWQDRQHFFAVAAQTMRRVLVDLARARDTGKRGGKVPHVPIPTDLAFEGGNALDLLALERALVALEDVDPRKVRVIELRFFGGLSVEETAGVLDVSAETVMRDWRLARSWLFRALNGQEV